MLHSRRLGNSHGEPLHAILGRVAFVELLPAVLAHALDPFPQPLRTLDALHLATLEFLREHGPAPRLLSYDQRLISAARKAGFDVWPASFG